MSRDKRNTPAETPASTREIADRALAGACAALERAEKCLETTARSAVAIAEARRCIEAATRAIALTREALEARRLAKDR